MLEDADMAVAVDSAMVAKMRNAGESCIGANRFYVHHTRAEEFSSSLAHAMSTLVLGDGMKEGVDVGPLVNASTINKVEQLVDQAVELGAKVLTGGSRLAAPGFSINPRCWLISLSMRISYAKKYLDPWRQSLLLRVKTK